FVAAGRRRGVLDAPMHPRRLSRPDRAGLATRAFHRDSHLAQHLERERIYLSGWMTARGVRAESSPAEVIQDRLGQDGPRRIARAEEEDAPQLPQAGGFAPQADCGMAAGSLASP